MVMQAAVGRRVFAENPDFGQEALRHVETLGRGRSRSSTICSRSSIRRRRRPSRRTCADLAGRVRATGRDLEFNTGEVDLAPSGARALQRIVQEAVTNALRHTESGRIRVNLEQVEDKVRLEVTNEGTGFAAPVPGRGMANMRERARLEGGELHAGPEPDGFSVRAVLPARIRT